MSRWISHGYSTPDDSEARQAREVEEALLCEYLPVIVENADRILETPAHFYRRLASAWLSSMWFYAGGLIPLGVLLMLWEAGEMRFECPLCEGTLYAVGACGSILSGAGSAWGVCDRCRASRIVRPSTMARTIVAVGGLLPCYRNLPLVEKGTQPRFDWKDGLKGEFTPDRVLVPAVEALDLWELICELAGINVGDYRRTPRSTGSMPRGLMEPITLEKRR